MIIEMFLWGVGGSVSVEIVDMYRYLNNSNPTLPKRYKSILFWIVRFCLAIVGGGLVVAYGIEKPILAINIGAATPLIIQSLAQAIPNTEK